MKGRGEDAMAAWLTTQLARATQDTTVSLRLDPKRADERNACPDFIIEPMPWHTAFAT